MLILCLGCGSAAAATGPAVDITVVRFETDYDPQVFSVLESGEVYHSTTLLCTLPIEPAGIASALVPTDLEPYIYVVSSSGEYYRVNWDGGFSLLGVNGSGAVAGITACHRPTLEVPSVYMACQNGDVYELGWNGGSTLLYSIAPSESVMAVKSVVFYGSYDASLFTATSDGEVFLDTTSIGYVPSNSSYAITAVLPHGAETPRVFVQSGDGEVFSGEHTGGWYSLGYPSGEVAGGIDGCLKPTEYDPTLYCQTWNGDVYAGNSTPSGFWYLYTLPIATSVHTGIPFISTTCFPNPFNPSTIIHFDLHETSKVSLSVYDLTGRLLCELQRGKLPQGDYEIPWNGIDALGKPVPSGIYLYRLKVGDHILDSTHKCNSSS